MNSYDIPDYSPSFLDLVCNFLELEKGDTLVDLCPGDGHFISYLVDKRPETFDKVIAVVGGNVGTIDCSSLPSETVEFFDGSPYDFLHSNLRRGLQQPLKVFYPQEHSGSESVHLVGTSHTSRHGNMADYFKFNDLSCWDIASEIAGEEGLAAVLHRSLLLSGKYFGKVREDFVSSGRIRSIVELPRSVSLRDKHACILTILGKQNDGIDYYQASHMGARDRSLPTSFSPDEIQELKNAQDGDGGKLHVDLSDIRENGYDLKSSCYDRPDYLHVENVVPLEDLIKRCTKGLPPSRITKDELTENERSYRIVSNADFVNGKLGKARKACYFENLEDGAERCLLHPGDIVFNRILRYSEIQSIPNEPFPYELVADQNMFVISPDTSKVAKGYLEAFFSSDLGQDLLNKRRGGGQSGNVISLSLSSLLAIPVPIVSKERQQKIAENYYDHMTTIDNARREIEAARSAISGEFSELVPDKIKLPRVKSKPSQIQYYLVSLKE